jgi:hypothetical protein
MNFSEVISLPSTFSVKLFIKLDEGTSGNIFCIKNNSICLFANTNYRLSREYDEIAVVKDEWIELGVSFEYNVGKTSGTPQATDVVVITKDKS